MKIAVYSLAKNEEKHATAWAESCKDADYRVVTDTGSTDRTPDILRMAGVSVHTGNVMPWRWDEAHNLSLHHVPADADICVRLDLDERFKPDWREAIEEVWRPETTKMRYWYNWALNDDGTPRVRFVSDRVHSRRGYRWVGATHEGLVCWTGAEVLAFAGKLEIFHHRDKDKKHKSDLMLLEHAVREMPHDSRMQWYYARQLDYDGKPEARAAFEKYLGMEGGSATERAYACRVLARLIPDKAAHWYERACQESPHEPEGYTELAKLAHEKKDHVGALYWSKRATECSPNAKTHASDQAAYGSFPPDCAATNAYILGMPKLSMQFLEIALQRNPHDQRLQNNMVKLKSTETPS